LCGCAASDLGSAWQGPATVWAMLSSGHVLAAQIIDSGGSDYAVGWGTLTLINAGLAQSKNRSGLNWWLISLLLGPIATFLIVFLGPPRDR
jgi:hypothetical protein